MPSEDFNVLESVVHITAERDIASLEKVLLETLVEFKKFETLILLSLFTGDHQDCLRVTRSIPPSAFLKRLDIINQNGAESLVRPDQSISQCISKNQIHKTRLADTSRIIFPITVNSKVVGVLEVYDDHFDAETQKLIELFMQIYSNFLAVLHDNEHDTLTGLLNRKTFDTRISDILSLLPEDQTSFTSVDEERRDRGGTSSHWIGILDIDFFKSINDNFGHIYGDEVLILFADLMRKVFRGSDLLFRFGGEEFIVVLMHSSESDAIQVFERFRKDLAQTCFPQVGQVTVSIGMTVIDPKSHITDLLDRADKALYYAKDHGRNQLCNYGELLSSGLLSEQSVTGDIEIF